MNVSYIDPTFDRCAAALEWLSGADLRSIQQVYVPCASAAVHLLCRVEKKPDLTYTTRALSDAAYQTETNRGLTHKFAEGLPPHIRNSRCSDVIAKETIPYALWMLSAGDGTSALCRPASSTEILNKAEKQAFRSHTQTLHTLGLTYVASTDEDQFVGGGRPTPTVQMVLEPPIDRIVQFRQLRTRPSDQRKEIPAQMKELLARGSVLEGIRSSETTMAVEKTSTVNKQLETKDSAPRSSKETTPLQQTDKPTETAVNKPLVTPLPEEDSSTKRSAENETEMTAVDNDRPAKKIKTAPAATQNFLGLGAKRAKAARSKKRARNVGFVPTKGTKKSNTGSGVPMNEVLRLKYVKGFTQAVRNPCKLEDLI